MWDEKKRLRKTFEGLRSRTFGWKGKRFPRIRIELDVSILMEDFGATAWIRSSRTQKWQRCRLPNSLAPELIKLLEELL